jgi:hypothetical protein
MSEVKLSALTTFKLITCNDSCLHTDSRTDQGSKFINILIKICTLLILGNRRIALEPLHGLVIPSAILDYESLQHLRSTGKQISGRKTLEHLRTNEGKLRLADHAQHILIIIHIHTRLASDRSINLKLAEKILSEAEFARFQASADPRSDLLKLWVLKEAAAKLTGEGLRGYPNHTDFSPDDPRVQEIGSCYVAILEEEKRNAHAV